MECILLGTGGMMPMPFRWLTSLVVRYAGANYLFDAGEGTQIAMKKAKPGFKALRVIAVSHLHADHCLGIPGILMLRAQSEAIEPLTIVGPPGIRQFIEALRESIDFYLNFAIQYVEWSPQAADVAYFDENIRVKWAPLDHSIFCLGYRIEERERPGKFLIEKARALNIPEGPLWGQLQSGQEVMLADEKIITPDEVLGPPRPGRVVSYVVDTRPTDSILELCGASDVTFIEGMFSEKLAIEAREKGHLTVTEAAKLVRQAQVKRTVLVHFSPRYHDTDLTQLLKEAQMENPAVEIGVENQVYKVFLPPE